eukprot:105613-Pelagomonas_calceolata.AAC.6
MSANVVSMYLSSHQIFFLAHRHWLDFGHFGGKPVNRARGGDLRNCSCQHDGAQLLNSNS